MRRARKKQIEEIISLIREAHEEIRKQIAEQNIDMVRRLLGDCQESAIQVGNLIEQEEGEGASPVHNIEEYCEACYQIYSDMEKNEQSPSGVYRLLQKRLTAVENSVMQTVLVRLEVAFFCYKASMSDCLESIYFTAKKDPLCDAYFIPIPYFDKNSDGSFGEMHYEGEGCYPDTYELTDWKTYNVEMRRPDIIYIMNPYDDTNLVTSVHPDFYARRLKDLTDCLVYVPYFVHVINMPPSTALAPGILYSNMTFVQSEDIREYYTRNLLEKSNLKDLTLKTVKEKIIAMGSPKLDKVVLTDKDDYILPEKWRQAVDAMNPGQKIVLYNLTIYGALNSNKENGKAYMKKVRGVLEFFKKREDILLWLRPHPLLSQTLYTMRPQLSDEYERMIECYKSEGWGIFDDTADLNRAVAWVDASCGDESSVELLLQFLGKPVLIQNIENAGREPDEEGTVEAAEKVMETFAKEDVFNSYVIYEAEGETEWDRFSLIDFFSHLDVIEKYKNIQMAKIRSYCTNADGTAGEKIHEYTTALFRRNDFKRRD